MYTEIRKKPATPGAQQWGALSLLAFLISLNLVLLLNIGRLCNQKVHDDKKKKKKSVLLNLIGNPRTDL
jgi:hypothetical protein